MKTKAEQINRTCESGNALIYVLIAIALFAALSMTLGRQTNTSEAGTISDDKAELYAGQLISYAAQVKSALDQMNMSGVQIDQLIFTLPNQTGFETENPAAVPPVLNIYKVYHPAGGGIIPATLPDEAKDQVATIPPASWYIGRFSSVSWSPSAKNDVILTAYQVNRKVCEKINEKITGSPDIPYLAGATMGQVLLDPAIHGGSVVALSPTSCPGCNNMPSLCISNASNTSSFYSIVAQQ